MRINRNLIALASVLILCVAIPALVAQPIPPSPFSIYGYVFYENGTACNASVVNIINLDNSANWHAENSSTSNYYQLVLANGTDVNASETLQFDVKSPDGTQLNATRHGVVQGEVNNGGLFDFNISLLAGAGGVADAVRPKVTYPTSGSTVNLSIYIISTENFDDTFHVYLTNESIPDEYRANLSWFNWTSKYVDIPAKGDTTIGLQATIPAGVLGTKAFKVVVESTKWTESKSFDMGIFVTGVYS